MTRLRISTEMLRAKHLGGLDATIIGVTYEKEVGAVFLEIEGHDVPRDVDVVRLEQTTSINTRFVPDARR